MARRKVLVLGNDPQINEIDFNLLSPNVITIGVNRIWLKHIPNYFFFNDEVILNELYEKPEVLEKLISTSICFSSDWLIKLKKSKHPQLPQWLKIHNRPDSRMFPDSVTTAMRIFYQNYFNLQECTFYIAGVSLSWREPSHFWKKLQYPAKNNYTREWYAPRFLQIIQNFKYLKNLRYNMVSVNPESELNKFLRYENIGNLYLK